MFAVSWGALTLVLASAIGTYVYFSRYGEEERWVTHTQAVMTGLEEGERLLIEGESAVRGLVLTGNAEFASPYERSTGVVRDRFAELKRLTADNPRQQERLALLLPLIDERLATLGKVLRLYRERGAAAASDEIATGNGNRLSERIHEALQDMKLEEENLFRARLLRAESTSWRVNLGLVVGHTLAVLLASMSTFALYRQLTRRREADLETGQRARLLAVLNELPVGVLVADRDGRVEFGNRAVERIFERPLRDVRDLTQDPQGRLLSADGSPYDLEDLPLRRAVRTGQPVREEEVRLRRSSGEWVTLLADAAALRADKDPEAGSVAVFVELAHTARRMDEERQEARFRELFVSVLGHDLRNPLSVVLTGARSVARRDSLAPEQQKILARMISSAERMSRMIDELMDLSRIRLGGGIQIDPHVGDLGAICRAVVDEFEVTNPERRFELALQGDLGGAWDRDRLAQLLSNLIGNAVQHGDASAPIRISLRGQGDRASLEVHNEGRAIPDEVLSSIFDPFRRAATGAPTAGLGLSLYIARQIVLAHGGTIAADSQPGRGTTFRVDLPRQVPS